MEQLSNLDVIILIVIALSALLAFYRGLIKEVLSIVGWVLLTLVMIYLLPSLTPLFNKYIESGLMSGIAASIFVFVVFFILWFIFTGYITGKIRSSKLNLPDRFLGLFFGILRACLLIVLMYIAIGWVVPYNEQPDFLKKSKYYNIAGSFAKPLENLLPEKTIKTIKEGAGAASKKDKDGKSDSIDELFDKLSQPKIKPAKDKKAEKSEKPEGYDNSERKNMDRLIENVAE